MKLKTIAKTTLIRLDQLSPYPLLYPFIMSKKEKALFDDVIKESRHYLEFGLGGSTLRAIQRSKAIIYTVESSPEWINYMRKYVVVRHFEKTRLHIFPVNIGPVRAFGYPESDKFQNFFETYSSSVFRSIDSQSIDLALIDGRFRVACTLKIIQTCHANIKILILIHDFWKRPHYHVVLKYLEAMDRADNMGLFSIKKDIDLESVKKDYEVYKFTPE